jgi:hypothetical protein
LVYYTTLDIFMALGREKMDFAEEWTNGAGGEGEEDESSSSESVEASTHTDSPLIQEAASVGSALQSALHRGRLSPSKREDSFRGGCHVGVGGVSPATSERPRDEARRVRDGFEGNESFKVSMYMLEHWRRARWKPGWPGLARSCHQPPEVNYLPGLGPC